MLDIEGVYAGYGDIQVLHDVSLHVDDGEIVGVVGANGAGKTTLLRSLMGLIPTRSGRTLFRGTDITRLPTHRTARMGMGQVMEGRRLFPHMTVEENLIVGAGSLGPVERRKNLAWVFEMFPRLRERRNQLARSLSGGEQQMVAIGRALMSSPHLLLLDEPSIGLAPVIVKEIYARFREINERGVTLLLVEQDVRRALSISSRGYVMERGRVVMTGAGKELLANDELVRAYLGIEATRL